MSVDYSGSSSNSKWKIVAVISTLLLTITVSGIGFFVLGRLSVDNKSDNSNGRLELKSPLIENNIRGESEDKTPTFTLRRKSSPTPAAVKKITLSALPNLDGYVNSDGTGSTSQDIKAGFSTTSTTRGFVAFDLTKIPPGANIIKATVRLFQIRVDENPFVSGEKIVIDHLNYGEMMDATDFAMPALIYSFSEVSVGRSVGWREIDSTRYVNDDMQNTRGSAKFRLHFINEDTTEASNEFVYFESAEDYRKTGNLPQLVVEYN